MPSIDNCDVFFLQFTPLAFGSALCFCVVVVVVVVVVVIVVLGFFCVPEFVDSSVA